MKKTINFIENSTKIFFKEENQEEVQAPPQMANFQRLNSNNYNNFNINNNNNNNGYGNINFNNNNNNPNNNYNYNNNGNNFNNNYHNNNLFSNNLVNNQNANQNPNPNPNPNPAMPYNKARYSMPMNIQPTQQIKQPLMPNNAQSFLIK